jgi:type I restriction enzyme R subunit
VALHEAKAKDVTEALNDPKKKEVFNSFMNPAKTKMAGKYDTSGKYIKGIEDYLETEQYDRDEHREQVVEDIHNNWLTLSQNGKFHAIFATSSIPEAIEYYRLIKALKPELKITALFDPNIDNGGGVKFKTGGLVEILEDYNERYEQDFTLATHAKFKKDISARLSHKAPYTRIGNAPEKQIDLLIVVDQMLTGFDSKWINTLYLDKIIKYESIIQAFSRTNRLFGPDKPFGTIRYYRNPHTMEQNIKEAVKLYSGDKVRGLFAEHLSFNLNRMNAIFYEISTLYQYADISDFEKLPDDITERAKFAKSFKEFNTHLEAAKIQGFKWDKSSYQFGIGKEKTTIELTFDHNTYLILALRYKELASGGGAGGNGNGSVAFEIEGYLTEIDTGMIDAEYMNSRFTKYLKTLAQTNIDPEQLQKDLDELHKSFATLSQEEQKFANIFIHDVHSGEVRLDANKSFREYITEYQNKAKNLEIYNISHVLGLDEAKLRSLMNTNVTEANINEYGRFDDLKSTVDKTKAKAYFETLENNPIPLFKVNIRIHNLLQEFILRGGFEV